MTNNSTIVTAFSVTGLVLTSGLALAAGQYGPGVSDTEIRIGQTMPYSGRASSYGVFGRAEAAYFKMINEMGGVNGRKLDLISLDDGYSPPKTVEQTRRLIEQEQVAFIFGSAGTPTNAAIRSYLNDNRVPQLFVGAAPACLAIRSTIPGRWAGSPSYRIEARIYARYILENLPNAKIAVLYQNDDFGKDYLIGMREGLGNKADGMIVATKTYETTDPTVNSQIVALAGSGADVLLTAAVPKFAAQAIRKVYDLGWKPTHFLSNVSNSVRSVMQPAGPVKGVGVISAGFLKDPTDPQWHDTPEYKEWLAWMKKYNSSANVADAGAVYGYSAAQTMVTVLKACGDNLTRENIMKQAASIHNLKLPMLLPGITISTTAGDFAPIKQMQLMKFDGETWKLFGEVLSGPAVDDLR